MRLAAQWTDSYPVAEFWFIWSDKLGLPEYPTVYITLAMNELGAFLWLGLLAAAPLIGLALFVLVFLIALVGRRLRWQRAIWAIPLGIVLAAAAIFLTAGFFMHGSALPGFW